MHAAVRCTCRASNRALAGMTTPARYGAYYAARTRVAAVAETIQVFRGRDLAVDDLER